MQRGAIKSAVKLRRVPTGAVVIQRSILPGKGCGRLTSDSLKSADLIMQMTWLGLIGEECTLNIISSHRTCFCKQSINTDHTYYLAPPLPSAWQLLPTLRCKCSEFSSRKLLLSANHMKSKFIVIPNRDDYNVQKGVH